MTEAADVHHSGPVVGLLGIADDSNSSHLGGASQAPPLIRAAMQSDSANAYTEIGRITSFNDRGDLGEGSTHHDIIQSVRTLLDAGEFPFVLGGDHAISFPVIAAIHEWRYENLAAPSNFAVLHFDAHTDTYLELDGNRYSHACPFARVCDELEPAPPLTQIGVRTLTPQQREFATEFEVACCEARNFPETRAELRKMLHRWLPPPPASYPSPVLDVYISIDLDALDPAYAPGVSHHEPGGLSTRQVLSVLHHLPPHCRVIGADCVEYNPTRDINGMTAMVAAKLSKELIALIKQGVEELGPPERRAQHSEQSGNANKAVRLTGVERVAAGGD